MNISITLDDRVIRRMSKKVGSILLKYAILMFPALFVVGIYAEIVGMRNDELLATLIPSIASVWTSFAYIDWISSYE